MTPGVRELTLESAAGGVAPELFERGLKEVLENIADPMTGDGKRTLVLTFTFDPHEDKKTGSRNEMELSCALKTKLAPVVPASSFAFMGRKGGKLVGRTHDVRQADAFDDEKEALGDGTEADTGTGEVTPIGSKRPAGA